MRGGGQITYAPGYGGNQFEGLEKAAQAIMLMKAAQQKRAQEEAMARSSMQQGLSELGMLASNPDTWASLTTTDQERITGLQQQAQAIPETFQRMGPVQYYGLERTPRRDPVGEGNVLKRAGRAIFGDSEKERWRAEKIAAQKGVGHQASELAGKLEETQKNAFIARQMREEADRVRAKDPLRAEKLDFAAKLQATGAHYETFNAMVDESTRDAVERASTEHDVRRKKSLLEQDKAATNPFLKALGMDDAMIQQLVGEDGYMDGAGRAFLEFSARMKEQDVRDKAAAQRVAMQVAGNNKYLVENMKLQLLRSGTDLIARGQTPEQAFANLRNFSEQGNFLPQEVQAAMTASAVRISSILPEAISMLTPTHAANDRKQQIARIRSMLFSAPEQQRPNKEEWGLIEKGLNSWFDENKPEAPGWAKGGKELPNPLGGAALGAQPGSQRAYPPEPERPWTMPGEGSGFRAPPLPGNAGVGAVYDPFYVLAPDRRPMW